MNVIASGRYTGKTTELLKYAIERNAQIVTHDAREADRLYRIINSHNFNLYKPITWQDFLSGEKTKGRQVTCYLIDNIDICLSMTARNAHVELITLTGSARKAGSAVEGLEQGSGEDV